MINKEVLFILSFYFISLRMRKRKEWRNRGREKGKLNLLINNEGRAVRYKRQCLNKVTDDCIQVFGNINFKDLKSM